MAKNFVPAGMPLTNNVAEYHGIISLLEWMLSKSIGAVDVFGDSMLVIKQVLGEYRVHARHLMPLARKAKELVERFQHISLSHIHREANTAADSLCTEALTSEAGFVRLWVYGQ